MQIVSLSYPPSQEAPQLPPSVATIGFFDGMHMGHRYLLHQVKQWATRQGCAACAVTFSQHPLAALRPQDCPPLLTSLDEKLALMAAEGIDLCFVLQFDAAMARLTRAEFIRHFLLPYGVKALLVGYDHHFGSDGLSGALTDVQIGQQEGIDVRMAQKWEQPHQSFSSSQIRQFLQAGQVEAAAQLLGRPYSLQGQVVRGRQNGRRLGFPTANLLPLCPQQLVPRVGVYAVRATVEDQTYGGMLNIGYRPTFQNGTDCSIETHLFDFDADIYGATMTLHFVARLRDEKTFASLEALMRQLELDRQCAFTLLHH